MSATPKAIEAPCVFDTAIEGFVRAYQRQITPELKAEMAALGVDLENVAPSYHLEIFERAFRRAGELLYPQLSHSERWRRIGSEFVGGFVQTNIGKTLLMIARALGPGITLEKMVRTFRTGSNHVDAESRRHGPTDLELRTWMIEPFIEDWRGRETLHLEYRHGILEGVLSALNVKASSVEVVEKDLYNQSVRYRIRWTR